jgi:uncharacterized protein YjhX (UPF0386 family)
MLKIEKSLQGYPLSTVIMPYCGEHVKHIKDEEEEIKRIVAERDAHKTEDLKFIVKKNAKKVALIPSNNGRSYRVTLFSEPFAKRRKQQQQQQTENPQGNQDA